MDQRQFVCRTCNSPTLHARNGTSHLLHFLLSTFTLGFWVPVWILSCVRIGGWKCQRCGAGSSTLVWWVFFTVAILLWTMFILLASHNFIGGLFRN